MSGYKGGFNFGGWGLDTDLTQEQREAGEKGTRLAKAKKTGAGIGGLLGALVLTIATGGTAAPLLLAAAGGAGALAGSAIGGATSGTSQADILGGNYLKNTRGNITKDIAKDEFMNVGKAALSSFMQGMNPTSGLNQFGKGWKDAFTASKAGGGSFLKNIAKGFGGGTKAWGTTLMDKIPGKSVPGGTPDTSIGLGRNVFGANGIGDATGTDIPGLLGSQTGQPGFSFTPNVDIGMSSPTMPEIPGLDIPEVIADSSLELPQLDELDEFNPNFWGTDR